MKAIADSIYEEIFPQRMQKSDRTKINILDSAIWCYVNLGIEKSTYDNISARAKISRPLVMRYFPKKEIIFELAVKYIRANLQKTAVDAISGISNGDEILKAYIKSTFRWLDRYPDHAKVWLLFYYYCGIDKNLSKVNTELVEMGHARIVEILKVMTRQKKSKISKIEVKAKIIQNLITGTLLSKLTEQNSNDILNENQLIGMCLEILAP